MDNQEPPATTKQHHKAFDPITFDMGQPRVDLTKAAALPVELEDDEILRRYRLWNPEWHREIGHSPALGGSAGAAF